MVRYQVFVGYLVTLELLHGVVEEKIDENSVDLCVRMLPDNLSPNEFDNPNAASYNLIFG